MGSNTADEHVRDPLWQLLNEVQAEARRRIAGRALLGRRLAERELAARNRLLTPDQQAARESLFTAARFYVASAISGYGGGGDAWRTAYPSELVEHIDTRLRAGLAAHLDYQAIEDGAAAARALLEIEP